MKKKSSNVFLWIFLMGVVVSSPLLFPHTAQAIRPFDFGGRVGGIVPCIHGFWVMVAPPYGGSYFYIPGFSGLKQFGPPTKPGQLVLGQSLGVQVCFQPCPIGTCPVGVGFLVFPNAGSSLVPKKPASEPEQFDGVAPGEGGYEGIPGGSPVSA